MAHPKEMMGDYGLFVHDKLVRPQCQLDDLPASWTCWSCSCFLVKLQTTLQI